MKVLSTFSTELSRSTVEERIGAYLEDLGYTRSASESSLAYERGSKRRSKRTSSARRSPKRWRARVTAEVGTGENEPSRVAVTYDIDATRKILIPHERKFWRNELRGLVAAVTGAQESSVRATVIMRDRATLQEWFAMGANSFLAIGGLALLPLYNRVAHGQWLPYELLGISYVIDEIATALPAVFGPAFGKWIEVARFTARAVSACVFVVIGFLARRGVRWSFTLGCALYACDTLFALVAGEVAGLVLHAIFLLDLISAWRALVRLDALREAEAYPG
jgi:hypothetical protein